MPVVAHDLATVRTAVDELVRSASACASSWTTPRAPGKWSPSQLVEHVARSLEASAEDLQGRRSGFPQLPAPVRLLARSLLFKRVLRNGGFPRAKTNRARNPESGPATVEDGRLRLEAAWRELETACSDVGESVPSRVFGSVPVGDYLRFQALHVHHHRQQLPG